MLIDCSTCAVRDLACGDCVVTALLGPHVDLTDREQQALGVLADSGLVAPLRLIPVRPESERRRPSHGETAPQRTARQGTRRPAV
jgi:hypothetical protein